MQKFHHFFNTTPCIADITHAKPCVQCVVAAQAASDPVARYLFEPLLHTGGTFIRCIQR
jgi:hypothetical protein